MLSDNYNCFNEYFYSVFTKDDSQQQLKLVSTSSTENISFSMSDVFNIMSTLDTTESTGINHNSMQFSSLGTDGYKKLRFKPISLLCILSKVLEK